MALPSSRRSAIIAIALAVITTLGFEAYLLWQVRQERWNSAVQSNQNILLTLSSNIDRNLHLIDLSLAGAQEALEKIDVASLNPLTRNALLFDRAASAEYVGSMLILSPSGEVVHDSGAPITPRTGNFSDRDYFKAHIDAPGPTYLSRPYESRLRNGDPSIALSRRITRSDGVFGGVVIGAMRLAYFQSLFSQINVGRGGVISLVGLDSRIVLRVPSTDGAGNVNLDLSKSPVFQRMKTGSGVFFSAPAAIDGVVRHYVYGRVGSWPLILSVAFSVDDVLGAWRLQALAFGAIGILLSCGVLTLSVVLQRALARETRMADEMEVLATTDALTGLSNRREFEKSLAAEWARAARGRLPLTLLMIDVDHFKAVNDRFGHALGDEVLKAIAATIKQAMRRPADLAARYGGEEFVALLPDTDEAGGREMAEHIRRSVAEIICRGEDGSEITATISTGVCTMGVTPNAPLNALFRMADNALYEAKRSGRNRTVSRTLKAGAAELRLGR